MASPPPGFRYIDVHTHLHPEWLSAAKRCPNLYLDTTAAMAPQSAIYRNGHGASPADVTDADLVRGQDRILFESDFPNALRLLGL